MSWEIIALIAIIAVVLISIPVLIIMWKISKRTLGTFDEIHKDMRRISFKEDPFEALDARVKKMTGPGSNPFEKV
jgi:hypothetical protein